MSLRCLMLVVIFVFISTEAVSGVDVMKAVGDQVSFRPNKFIPPVSIIIWKHTNTAGTVTVKAIEWDEGEILIPNPRFRDITTVDEKTGQITITNLKVEHSGVYTIDINSKEQQQRFTLTVKDVMKAVGDRVSFRPNKFIPPVSIIIWKHTNTAGNTVKAIEWDEGEILIPNPRFRDITTVDEKTGQITITNLKVEHSGVYTIDINSKEQEQRFTLTVMGENVKKAVGDQVSFRPDKFPDVHSLTSIIWKHRSSSGILVKAIKWDEGEILIPNPRFRDITTVDEMTGQITITNLKVEHSGVYTIYINSKEQEQRFNLTVMERVPEPEKSEVNPDVVHLRCAYSDKTKKSTREELKCSAQHSTGESITVKNEGNTENLYTCTLDKSTSKETSDPV